MDPTQQLQLKSIPTFLLAICYLPGTAGRADVQPKETVPGASTLQTSRLLRSSSVAMDSLLSVPHVTIASKVFLKQHASL